MCRVAKALFYTNCFLCKGKQCVPIKSVTRLYKLADTAVHKIFKHFAEHFICGTGKVIGLRNLQELIDERQSKFMNII